mgnify:FL=1
MEWNILIFCYKLKRVPLITQCRCNDNIYHPYYVPISSFSRSPLDPENFTTLSVFPVFSSRYYYYSLRLYVSFQKSTLELIGSQKTIHMYKHRKFKKEKWHNTDGFHQLVSTLIFFFLFLIILFIKHEKQSLLFS